MRGSPFFCSKYYLGTSSFKKKHSFNLSVFFFWLHKLLRAFTSHGRPISCHWALANHCQPWPALGRHGWPWPLGRPWPFMASHSRPWPAMVGHRQRRPAMAGHGWVLAGHFVFDHFSGHKYCRSIHRGVNGGVGFWPWLGCFQNKTCHFNFPLGQKYCRSTARVAFNTSAFWSFKIGMDSIGALGWSFGGALGLSYEH